MKDYKRLTFDCWKYDEFLKQDEKYVRLAELEDKIESGELCDRKETAREIADWLRSWLEWDEEGVIRAIREKYDLENEE